MTKAATEVSMSQGTQMIAGTHWKREEAGRTFPGAFGESLALLTPCC